MPNDIRTSKVRLKFVNKGKLKSIYDYLFDNQVSIEINNQINHLIYHDVKKRPDKSFTDNLKSKLPKLSSRTAQLLASEISSSARSIVNKIKKINPSTNQKYQQEILYKFKSRTLNVSWNGYFHLDNRFVDIQVKKNSKVFDLWIKISIPKFGVFYLPINMTRHMRSLMTRGYKLKPTSMLLRRDGYVELLYERDFTYKKTGKTLGIDIGRNKIFVTSNNERSTAGLLLDIVRRKHGSKNQKRRIRSYKQYVDRSIRNNIDLSDIKEIKLEDLRGIKYKKKWGRFHHHWNHSYIKFRLQLIGLENDVRCQDINPAYTSQTCNFCGHVDKMSRNREHFTCTTCGYIGDADLNAAINISRK